MKNKPLLIGSIMSVLAPALFANPVAVFGKLMRRFIEDRVNLDVVSLPRITELFIMDAWLVRIGLFALSALALAFSITIICGNKPDRDKYAAMLLLVVGSLGGTLLVLGLVALGFFVPFVRVIPQT